MRTERNMYEKQAKAIKAELEECKTSLFAAQNGDLTGRDARERLVSVAQAANVK